MLCSKQKSAKLRFWCAGLRVVIVLTIVVVIIRVIA